MTRTSGSSAAVLPEVIKPALGAAQDRQVLRQRGLVRRSLLDDFEVAAPVLAHVLVPVVRVAVVPGEDSPPEIVLGERETLRGT